MITHVKTDIKGVMILGDKKTVKINLSNFGNDELIIETSVAGYRQLYKAILSTSQKTP